MDSQRSLHPASDGTRHRHRGAGKCHGHRAVEQVAGHAPGDPRLGVLLDERQRLLERPWRIRCSASPVAIARTHWSNVMLPGRRAAQGPRHRAQGAERRPHGAGTTTHDTERRPHGAERPTAHGPRHRAQSPRHMAQGLSGRLRNEQASPYRETTFRPRQPGTATPVP
jgi:hypothetical protein